MIQSIKINKPDIIGVFASSLCLIHCAATPFIFFVKACSTTCCADTPLWWKAVDYLFLIISFIAIFYAAKASSKKWVITALWSSWGILLLTILDETYGFGLFPDGFIYIPALAIVGLHYYNYKYCKCAGESCCH